MEILLLTDVLEKTTSSGKPYLQLSFKNADRVEISAKMWNQSKENFNLELSSLVKAELKCDEYNGQKNYIVNSLTSLTEEEMKTADINNYINTAPFKPEVMYDYLIKMANSIADPYKTLVLKIYEDNKEKILMWSAAKKVHHNVKGGFLWHTMYVTQICNSLSKLYVYPFLNRDLLLAGAMLHDIGKLKELETNGIGESSYTNDGTLLGHILMGSIMVNKYAREIEGFDEEKIMLITHMIASHHGEKDWGAFETPKLPEAFLLNHADMIDAKMNCCKKALQELEPGTVSENIFGLGTKLYKKNLNSQITEDEDTKE